MIHSTSIQRDYDQGTLWEILSWKLEKEESLEVVKDSYRDELSPFEQLVREALATIPTEFHEQMENVLVRVQYEPGEEVMDRVGVKEGYTLLGLIRGCSIDCLWSSQDATS